MRSHIYDNPADDPETEPFLKAITAAPGDGLPRHIFSDWLEENGYDNAAKGQRWAAKYAKRPHPSGNGWLMGGNDPSHHTGLTKMSRGMYNQGLYPSVMPRGFFRDNANDPEPRVSHGQRMWSHGQQAELHFLGRSHELQWHPETGEPKFDK